MHFNLDLFVDSYPTRVTEGPRDVMDTVYGMTLDGKGGTVTRNANIAFI